MRIEGRLTCELRPNSEIPPAEVEHMMFGSEAHMHSEAGDVTFQLLSPTRFRRQGNSQIVVINQFSLASSSDLYGRPSESLKNYDVLRVPVNTIVYGKNLQNATLYEVSVSINGKDVWYYSFRFQQPTIQDNEGHELLFRIPLEGLKKRLFGDVNASKHLCDRNHLSDCTTEELIAWGTPILRALQELWVQSHTDIINEPKKFGDHERSVMDITRAGNFRSYSTYNSRWRDDVVKFRMELIRRMGAGAHVTWNDRMYDDDQNMMSVNYMGIKNELEDLIQQLQQRKKKQIKEYEYHEGKQA